ncbi:uncharacterized protein PG986_014306 [Apiospora aurea]|uniref:Uncharacterized protein n=1 Tax=Apiospora aurea TaxID=335848 RepID=A0ABR1PSP5_9PEZI
MGLIALVLHTRNRHSESEMRSMAVYGVADSCYEYDASEEEVSLGRPRPRLAPHEEARCAVDATEEIKAILIQKLERFQGDLRLYKPEPRRAREDEERDNAGTVHGQGAAAGRARVGNDGEDGA